MIIPSEEIYRQTSTVRGLFLRWTDFMYHRIHFNIPDSKLHSASHCERVLLFALLIGGSHFDNDYTALEILAQAAVFHDTCRFDEYLDVGHGARAAAYYKDFCNTASDVYYHPEVEYLMRFHDRDDNDGKVAIENSFGNNAVYVLNLYDIFKDADALDRWRLGYNSIDVRYIRTDSARHLLDFAERIVSETVPEELRRNVEHLIEKQINSQN